MWIKQPKKTDFRVLLSIGIIVVAMGMFSLARLALYLFHHEIFSSLTGLEVLGAFWNGLRFDLSMVALFLGPIILLFNLKLFSRCKFFACFIFKSIKYD